MLPLRWCVVVLLLASLAAGEIKNKGWWKNAVFYQIYPRSFMDSNGDGIGDLNGITSKLQHFVDSNITAIWLSPIYASPMVDFGYDISDFRDVNPEYGTMEDFRNLTKAAKDLGIKVIMDLVPNHTSDKHEWFKNSLTGQSKYKYYYMWKKGKKENKEPPNNWISVFSGPAWTYSATRDEWYFHQFEYRQPDLNYTNPDVRNEMEEIIKFWLEKGIDGFRIDAIPHVYEDDNLQDEPRSGDKNATPRDYNYLEHKYTKDDERTYNLTETWRNLVDKWADEHDEDEKVLMTEAYTSLNMTTKYYDYGSNVPFNFNFIMGANKDSKPEKFKEIIDSWVEQVPSGQSANWVMGNHDRNRLATRFPGRADQMTMLAMILPGIAVTYNGEEIGMEDKSDITWEEMLDPQACNDPEHFKERSRDPARTPFQWDDTKNAGFSKCEEEELWLPVNSNYKTLNLKKQQEVEVSHYTLYQTLTSLKKDSETLKSGGLKTEILSDDEVLAVVREGNEEDIILLINFNDKESKTLDIKNITSKGEKTFVLASNVESKVTWNEEVTPNNVTIPAKGSIILLANDAVALLIVPVKLILGMALFVVMNQMF